MSGSGVTAQPPFAPEPLAAAATVPPEPFSKVYRSAKTRSRVAIGALAAVGSVAALSMLHNLSGFALVQKAEAGILSNSEAIDFDTSGQLLAGAFLIALVAAAIAFLAWLSRSIDNVPSLGAGVPTVTPRWSIGWWFIPFANLWKPYQVVKDLGARMAPRGDAPGNGLILIWWLTWIGGNVFGAILLRMPEPETLDGLSTLFGVGVVTAALEIAGIILAILVVRQIQDRADRRAQVSGGAVTPAVQVP